MTKSNEVYKVTTASNILDSILSQNTTKQKVT